MNAFSTTQSSHRTITLSLKAIGIKMSRIGGFQHAISLTAHRLPICRVNAISCDLTVTKPLSERYLEATLIPEWIHLISTRNCNRNVAVVSVPISKNLREWIAAKAL